MDSLSAVARGAPILKRSGKSGLAINKLPNEIRSARLLFNSISAVSALYPPFAITGHSMNCRKVPKTSFGQCGNAVNGNRGSLDEYSPS